MTGAARMVFFWASRVAVEASGRRRAHLRGLNLDHFLADDVFSRQDHGDPVRVGVLHLEVLRARRVLASPSRRRPRTGSRGPNRALSAPAPPRQVRLGREGPHRVPRGVFAFTDVRHDAPDEATTPGRRRGGARAERPPRSRRREVCVVRQDARTDDRPVGFVYI